MLPTSRLSIAGDDYHLGTRTVTAYIPVREPVSQTQALHLHSVREPAL